MKVGSVESQLATPYKQFPSRGLREAADQMVDYSAISKVNDDRTVTHSDEELANRPHAGFWHCRRKRKRIQ